MAYKFEPPTLYLEVSTPRHGERPFEVCHLDHTELDIELISEATGKNLGRPWLTLLTDAFSRRVLGSWLTFDPPSYRSCMMVMRDCVKRYSRFPQILVVDGGSDFKSKYFEQLLARCECIKKTRPAAKSRFGSVIERLFGTCNTEFIHSLRGNTKITRNVRQVTESVNPRKLATWTFRELSERLGQYLFDVYDQCEHPALQQSPRETFLQGLNRHGERLQRRICFDDAFKFLTLPTTLKGTAKLEPGQGVQIHYLHYWSEAFREPELFGKQLPVRYDPFDASVAYAYCRNRWVECRSSLFLTFRGRSEREIAIATQELRQRSRHTKAARYGINAKLLADFLRSAESDELLSLQRERDREMKGEPVRPERATIGEMEIKTGAAPLIESRKQEIAKENRKNYGEF